MSPCKNVSHFKKKYSMYRVFSYITSSFHIIVLKSWFIYTLYNESIPFLFRKKDFQIIFISRKVMQTRTLLFYYFLVSYRNWNSFLTFLFKEQKWKERNQLKHAQIDLHMLLSHVLVFYIHMCATFYFTKLVYYTRWCKITFMKMLHRRDTQ